VKGSGVSEERAARVMSKVQEGGGIGSGERAVYVGSGEVGVEVIEVEVLDFRGCRGLAVTSW
jgi:hypothetical protein